MLTIKIPSIELFDEKSGEFYELKGQEIVLEHSLVSLSKWESKWHKPFLSKDSKTREEIIDYIKCMTITQNVNPELYKFIRKETLDIISNYIEDPSTATTITNKDKKQSREIITAEIIYYWMIAFNIPVEFQKWHLNKLLTLIGVCNIKNQPTKKMSKAELAANNRRLNAERRAKLGSGG